MSRHTTRNLSRYAFASVACLAALSFVPPASAAGQKGYGGTNRPTNNSNATNRNTAKPQEPGVNVPPADPAAAQQAQQSLAAARGERKKAEDNLASVSARLREEFDKSPEMAQAQADVKAAQAEYDAAAKPVLEKVHATPAYKTASDAKSHDQAQIDQLRGTPGNEAQIASLAQDAMTQAAAASKVENDAVAKEPGALAAKAKVTAANAKLGELRGQFNSGLTKNPDWVTAKKALDDAVQKLQTAEATYRQESGKLSSAQAAHNAAAAQKQKLDQEYAGTQKKTTGNTTTTNNNTPNQ